MTRRGLADWQRGQRFGLLLLLPLIAEDDENSEIAKGFGRTVRRLPAVGGVSVFAWAPPAAT